MVTIKRSSGYNSKKNRWLLILVSLVVILGIGLIGPAMALWGDSIYLNEDVNTGKVKTKFKNPKDIVIVHDGAHENPKAYDIEFSNDKKNLDFMSF